MNFGKLWKMVEDREAWHVAVHEAEKSQTRLSNSTTTPLKILQWLMYLEVYLKPPIDIPPAGSSLVAQSVKNLPAMQETRVQLLFGKIPWRRKWQIHFSILAWRIPTDRGAWQATVHGVARVGHNSATKPGGGSGFVNFVSESALTENASVLNH